MISITLSTADVYGRIRLDVEGHAQQAEHGQDIVCSAVSILTYTAAQIVKNMIDRGWCIGTPTVELESGNAHIEATVSMFHYDEASAMMEVIKTGYTLLQHNYPQYVRLIEP